MDKNGRRRAKGNNNRDGRGWCRVLDLISLVNRRETTRIMNREKPRGTKETRERERKGNYSAAGWGQQRQGTG